MLGIYIRGSDPVRIVRRVTCGDVGIEKAVVVPKPLFSHMLSKLEEFSFSRSYKSAWLSGLGAKQEIQDFLSRRCSKEFITLYLEQHPDLLNRVSKPGLFLDSVPEVRLAERLHEFGLLPEVERRIFVETVSNYAIEGEDLEALNDERIRGLFREDEFDELRNRVRAELVPRLDDVRLEWEFNHNSDDPAEEHMERLLQIFDVLKRNFGDDANAGRIIDQEIRRAQEWIDEHTSDEPKRSPRNLGNVQATDQPESVRSVFDDIDVDEDSDDARHDIDISEC